MVLLTFMFAMREVTSRTFPYISAPLDNPNYQRKDFHNNSYTKYNRYKTLICHTDLSTCCTSREGVHRGHWYFPNGTRLPVWRNRPIPLSFQSYSNMTVTLTRFFLADKTVGVYRCDIPTNAVNINNSHETLYIGRYYYSGEECAFGN